MVLESCVGLVNVRFTHVLRTLHILLCTGDSYLPTIFNQVSFWLHQACTINVCLFIQDSDNPDLRDRGLHLLAAPVHRSRRRQGGGAGREAAHLWGDGPHRGRHCWTNSSATSPVWLPCTTNHPAHLWRARDPSGRPYPQGRSRKCHFLSISGISQQYENLLICIIEK